MGLSDQKRIRFDILDLKVWISQAEAVPFFAPPKCSDYTGSDVVGGAENDSAMADKRAKRGGTNYCAAGGPNKVNCSSRTGTPGISVHYFPKDEIFRQKWTRFVRTHQKDFEGYSNLRSRRLCLAHFDDSCFERKPVFHGEGSGEAVEMRKLLIKGSVSSKNSDVPNTLPITKRKRRRVSFTIYINIPCCVTTCVFQTRILPCLVTNKLQSIFIFSSKKI